jgi:hypothetical protein
VRLIHGRPPTFHSAPTNNNGYVALTDVVYLGSGEDDGIPYCDIRLRGGAGLFDWQWEVGYTAGLSQGQGWTHSLYMRLLSNSGATTPTTGMVTYESPSGSGSSANASLATFNASSLRGGRRSYSYTLMQATPTLLSPRISFTAAGAFDFVLRVGGFQTENNYFASSLILPPVGSPAASTRAADSLSVTGAQFASIFQMQSRTNLLTRSDAFDDAAWIKTRATVAANVGATTAPDGTATADKIVADATAASTHQVGQIVSLTAGTTYSYSLYAKAAEISIVRLRINGSAFPVQPFAFFDLAAGTVTGATATNAANIISVGNGWHRLSVVATATTTAAGTAEAFLIQSGTNSNWDGDGVSGAFLWGAQLEAAPASLTAGNLIAASESIDHTSWVKGGAGTGTAAVVTANDGVAPDGTQSADRVVLALNGGTTTADQSQFAMGISATVGIGRTFSIYMRTTDGTTKSVRMDWAGTTPTTGTTGGLVTVTGAWQRFVITLDNATATGQQPFVRLRGTFGTADTASLWVWGATLEDGSGTAAPAVRDYVPLSRMVSGYIATGASAVTKSGAESGWCILDVSLDAVNAGAGNNVLLQFDVGNDGNRIIVRTNPTGGAVTLPVLLNQASGSVGVGSGVFPGTARVGFRLANGAASICVNGGAVIAHTTQATGVLFSALRLGANSVGGAPLNGRVRQIWAGAIPPSDLQMQQATTLGADVSAILG